MDGRINNKLKKVCFLVPGLNVGGIENHLLRFLEYLQKPDIITVLVRDEQKGELWNDFQKTGVNIRLQGVGFINPVRCLKLYFYFRKQQFYTVCDFNGNFAGIVMLIAKMAGVGNRITFYRRSSDAFQPTWVKAKYNKMVNRLVYNYATKILSNSQYAIDFFFPYKSVTDKRFRVLRNGIDINSFDIKETKEEARRTLNLPTDKFIIGHVGRWDPSKNHETIFEVARKLKGRGYKLLFLFIGGETNSSKFLKKVEDYNIEDICFCLGLQKRLSLWYKVMDLFYFPSVTEGLPNALLEAMVAGVPVLASNIPPIKECFDQHRQDHLIEPTDVDTAVNIIIESIEDRALLEYRIFKEMAISKFGMDRNFKLLYNELMNE